jgi:hypothetical protein
MDDDKPMVEMKETIVKRFIIFAVMLIVLVNIAAVNIILLVVTFPFYGFFIMHYVRFISNFTIHMKTRRSLHLGLFFALIAAIGLHMVVRLVFF